jgi:hypothetical protein
VVSSGAVRGIDKRDLADAGREIARILGGVEENPTKRT